MPAASFALIANFAIAAMFTASFLVVSRLNPGRSALNWLALSYAVGMLTPASEFLLPLSPYPGLFSAISYLSLLIAFSLTAPALRMHFRVEPRWHMAIFLVVTGAILRLAISGGVRGEIVYEFIFQLPYAIATGKTALVAWEMYARRGRGRPIAIVFTAVSAHFLLKPLGAWALGTGLTASQYVTSSYALFSQAFSGILLIAAGLVLLMTILQEVVAETRNEALTDALTGLPNRRALSDAFHRTASYRAKSSSPTCIALFDVDHFKRFNDRYGHHTGDLVLQAVAQALLQSAPAGALVTRLGGEEFAMLMPHASLPVARLACEKMRLSVASMDTGRNPITVSAGVSEVGEGALTLETALMPADAALYRAKANGRDRVVVGEPVEPVIRDQVHLGRAIG